MLKQHNVAMLRNGACDGSTDGHHGRTDVEAHARGSKNSSYVTRGRAYRVSLWKTDPAAYIQQAIRSDPDPRTRFLPLY